VYFERLLRTLGIAMTPNVRHFLTVKENKRTRRIMNVRLNETKKLWKQKIFARMKEDEVAARTGRDKRDGTYRPRQNMDEVSEDDQEQGVPKRKKAAPKVCPHCGKKGHSTR
jgi:hypothetical protein